MKIRYLLRFAFVFLLGVTAGQELTDTLQKSESVPTELSMPCKVFIPPPPPKAVPPMKVEAVVSRTEPSHRFTILRSDASALPDIPPPPPPQKFVSRPQGEAMPMVSLGATVYDRRISHLKWHEPSEKVWYEAWCAWDFSLLAPLSTIKVGEKTRMFMLFSSTVDTTKMPRTAKGNAFPVIPELTENTYVISQGDPKNADAILTLNALRDYYLKHRERLVLIEKAQNEYQQAAQAWHKANPPVPQDHTIWLKPHRGSRYLQKEGGER